MIANEQVQRLEQILEQVEIPGLTKLVHLEKYIHTSGNYSSPEWKQMSVEERREIVYNREHYKHVERLYVPKEVTTVSRERPRIKQAYSPVSVALPVSEDETYQQLKERIEKEIGRVVKHTKESYGDSNVNAYYIGDLTLGYIIPEERRSGIAVCMPIAGERFLEQPVKEVLFPRWTFDLALFEIE